MRLRRSVTALSLVALLGAFTALPTPPAYADSTTDTYIVQLKPGVSADAVVPKIMGSKAKVVHKVFQGGIVTLNATQAKKLAGSPYVKSVHKDALIHATGTQLNPPWDLDMLDSTTGAPDNSYTYPNNGSGVSVYVLDSGIYRQHAQFSGANIATGYDFINNDTDTTDCQGHGTAVSSLIAGSTLGASKGVTLVPLRVLDCFGSGSDSDVIRAAEWIAQNRTPGAPAVANLSLGVAGADASMEAALQGLIDAGVTVVAAAGNGDVNGNGLDACTESPARLPGAITVAAVDELHAEPKWTNYGSCVDLYAPGVNDCVAMIGSSNTGICTMSGTSFSAPLTSAAAAIVLHDHQTWTPAQVSAALVSQADDGVVIQQTRLDTQSPNKLLNVTGSFTGTDPTITGSLVVGQTLTASLHWEPTPTTLKHQWNRNGVAIPDATAATYVTTSDDVGQSLTVTVSGSGVGYHDVTGTSAAVVPVDPPQPGMVVSLTPSRLLDTRTGLGGTTGPLHYGQTATLHVAGVAGVAATASAVLVNITVTDASADGFVTAYASGAAMPATSNGNFQVGKVSATLALVPVGADGAIALTVRLTGSVHLVVDVQSYITGGATATDPGAVVPVTPTRLKDTRDPGNAAVGAGKTLDVKVTDVAGVPVDATAVFVNVTVTEPQALGYLTVFPSGEAVPATSNLNFVKGLTVPNLALVKVGSGGYISIQNGSPGTAQVIVDIQGYVVGGTPTTPGAVVVPVSPTRILDTRPAFGGTGAVPARTGVDVPITGASVPPGTEGVFMNLTVTEPQIPGWLAAYPPQASLPLVSNVNFVAGQTVPNLATVGLANGQVTLYNGSFASVQMVADVFAYIL